MMNNNNHSGSNNNLTNLSTGSSNSSSGSTGTNNFGAPMSLAAANVVRGIMEKVLATPPMGAGLNSGLTSSSSAASRLFNELDYLSSPGLDSDFGDTSPLLCASGPTSSSSSNNLSNQYLRLAIGNPRENHLYGLSNSHHSNCLSR